MGFLPEAQLSARMFTMIGTQCVWQQIAAPAPIPQADHPHSTGLLNRNEGLKGAGGVGLSGVTVPWAALAWLTSTELFLGKAETIH